MSYDNVLYKSVLHYITLQIVYWNCIMSIIISANDVCFCLFDCWYFIHQLDHDHWRSQDLWFGGPVISQLQCVPNATQVNTICILYSYFPISSLLKFFSFSDCGSKNPRTPLDHLKTINLTEFLEGLDIGTVTLHGSSLGLVLVMIWIYNSFIVSLCHD